MRTRHARAIRAGIRLAKSNPLEVTLTEPGRLHRGHLLTYRAWERTRARRLKRGAERFNAYMLQGVEPGDTVRWPHCRYCA